MDTDEWDALVENLKAQGINILEQTMFSGGRSADRVHRDEDVDHTLVGNRPLVLYLSLPYSRLPSSACSSKASA